MFIAAQENVLQSASAPIVLALQFQIAFREAGIRVRGLRLVPMQLLGSAGRRRRVQVVGCAGPAGHCPGPLREHFLYRMAPTCKEGDLPTFPQCGGEG